MVISHSKMVFFGEKRRQAVNISKKVSFTDISAFDIKQHFFTVKKVNSRNAMCLVLSLKSWPLFCR